MNLRYVEMNPVPMYFCKLTVLNIGVLALLLGTPEFSAMQLRHQGKLNTRR